MRKPDGSLAFASVSEAGDDAIVTHDARADDPSLAFALAQLSPAPTGPTPIGVFRDVDRPVYAETLAGELESARDQVGDDDLDKLLAAGYSWTV